ncbi:MAG: hypothetical protein V1750_07955, partial [Acidobacteriota bacterium]
MPAELPPPALAEAVRGGQWAQVSTLTRALPAPLSPAVALVAARAAYRSGDGERALVLLREALPRAGELAAALRLEIASITLANGGDPWPQLARLVQRGPLDHRRAAGELFREAWGKLPLAVLQRHTRHPLPRSLRRELLAVLAQRSRDRGAALHVLRERRDDGAALVAARFLAAGRGLTANARLLVAEALLAGGLWCEAEALLAAPVEAASASRHRFLRGRAAYRLGKLTEAARELDGALAVAPDPAARFATAVQRARVAELMADGQTALGLWDVARTARPGEVEGWDGGARARLAAGRTEEAVALVLRAPPAVQQIAGPRLAAGLLARKDAARASELLGRLPRRLAIVRALRVAAAVAGGDLAVARRLAVELLADPGAGGWRELVLELLPTPDAPAGPSPAAVRDPQALAAIATAQGAAAAQAALLAALRLDAAWAPVVTGGPPAPSPWDG